jgi:UDP-N-acetylmuramoyl-tripeptide--D-alanyl-D-alanine ligase
MTWILTAVFVVLAVLDGMRWLRVAQREHYIAGSVTTFARRWRRIGVGLSWRGRTSKLVFTRRMKVLAAMTALVHVVIAAVLAVVLPVWAGALVALLVLPVSVDIALFVTAPIERRGMATFVEQATKKLRQINPTIVGITGSYGKTSTKVVVAHLVAGTRSVAASPASFNNLGGLTRAVNEGLPQGTDVFVAEMGTYGKGEIAELCEWCPPAIAVMTAIGPVHLERFGTEDNIVEAKSEIFVTAHTLVCNVDEPRLAAVADRVRAEGVKKVVRASGSDPSADVAVLPSGDVFVGGQLVGHADTLPTAPSNAACAVAVAIELGVPAADAAARLASAPGAAHRLEAQTAPSGAIVLDDTFNSNPAGAQRALDVLASSGAPTGTKVLITPGMIELGNRQAAENERFAENAGRVATVIGIVGASNRKPLATGAAKTSARVELFKTREDAVAWVRTNLGPGDAVLYENDLPDHYP